MSHYTHESSGRAKMIAILLPPLVFSLLPLFHGLLISKIWEIMGGIFSFPEGEKWERNNEHVCASLSLRAKNKNILCSMTCGGKQQEE